jgi:hypothetical protein
MLCHLSTSLTPVVSHGSFGYWDIAILAAMFMRLQPTKPRYTIPHVNPTVLVTRIYGPTSLEILTSWEYSQYLPRFSARSDSSRDITNPPRRIPTVLPSLAISTNDQVFLRGSRSPVRKLTMLLTDFQSQLLYTVLQQTRRPILLDLL